MKFEKLNDTKIKISVSMHDMEQNNVSIQNLFSNSESSQKLLQNILKMAENEIDFKASPLNPIIFSILSQPTNSSFPSTVLTLYILPSPISSLFSNKQP